ncbi:MAG: TlpA family protein disulfide reductase [Acidobacteria bacterium]|nr:TlpA family protein disulfide reductase [Acidobacteriota bacterium]
MVQQFNGSVRFVVENYGQSKLAQRFGVKRYPAIFVDDILVATPNDFGFFGKGEGNSGRYAPLRSAASHERFRSDLTRMLQLVLAGKTDDARARAASATSNEIAALPQLSITDLDGKPLTRAQLAGRAVIVEFWATWCPPCRGTLEWLGTLKKRYGDRVAVVGLAVESPEADVRKLTRELALPVRWGLATPELARSFGDISAVPTLFLFDKTGKTAGVFYGAPPTLHAAVETKVAAVLR